jgi:hypothetical protein
VRLGLTLPALIQRRIVGTEICKCLQDAAVFSHGSEDELGTAVTLFDFMFYRSHSNDINMMQMV